MPNTPADQTYLNQTQVVLPEYQEKFYKDFLASVAAQGMTNPLEGVPEARLAEFTPAQLEAIKMGISNMGAYKPMMEAGAQTLNEGIGVYGDALGAYGQGMDAYGRGLETIGGTMGSYDPQSYKAFMDPYTQEVIDSQYADINRQSDIERNRLSSKAIGAGAFGGSRGALQESELQRNTADQVARTGSGLRSAGFQQAQSNAMNAFENQQNRGQTAAQIFGSLGSGLGSLGSGIGSIGEGLGVMGVRQGAMGEAAQAAGTRDVNSLFNLGSLEQGQIQAGYDVNRQNALETAYEPYRRLGFMSDMFRGVPTTQGTMTSGSVPSPSPYSTFLGTAMGLGGYQQANNGTSLLGGILNSSGA